MNEKLRVGIVGCGGIARAHLAAYKEVGAAEVAAVYDVSQAAAERLAGEAGAEVAGSLEEMATKRDLDAVSVCTPPGVHHETCLPFLEAGVAVLCEKPFEADTEGAQKLAGAAKGSRSVFMTAFCHRFHPPVVELKKLADSGVLGRPVLFRNIFSGYFNLKGDHRSKRELSGGGTMIDTCSHSVDLFRFIMGDPVGLQCMTGTVLQDVPVDDFCLIQLDSGEKSFGEITGSSSFGVGASWVELYGTEGAGMVSYWNAGQPDLKYATRKNKGWTEVDCSGRPGRFPAQVAHFLECVREGREPAVTAADGLAAARIITALYQAAESGARVALEW